MSYFKATRGSAIAEGPRGKLVSRNSATGPIVCHYLRDPTFSHFHTISESDRHPQTDRRMADT